MILAVTGHRDKSLPPNARGPITSALMLVLNEFNPDQAISGMSSGVDLYFAECCVDIGIYLIAALPCLNQEAPWKNHPETIALYKDLLGKAQETIYVSDKPYSDGCMLNRNKWMVNRCDMLVAVWDGKNGGGTSYTVKKAKEADKPVIVIDPWGRRVR